MDVVLPKLGLTITEAEVGTWHRRVGEEVAESDVLVDILMDKADVEVAAPVSGVLSAILVDTGTVVAVGTVIALIDNPSAEPLDSMGAPIAAGREPGRVADTVPVPDNQSPAVVRTALGGRTLSSPRARATARRNGIDIRTVTGTGPRGRIVSRDVLLATTIPVAPQGESTHPPAVAAGFPSRRPPALAQRCTVAGHVVLRRASYELPADLWLAMWMTAGTMAVRNSGLAQVTPGEFRARGVTGPRLEQQSTISGIDDLSVIGVARGLRPQAGPDPLAAKGVDLLLVDLRPSAVDEIQFETQEELVTMVVGNPTFRSRLVDGDSGTVLQTEYVVRVHILSGAAVPPPVMIDCLHLLGASLDSLTMTLLGAHA